MEQENYMTNLTLHHLRVISLVEGISYLLLVGIGMPLKYGLNILFVNKILGMAHGLLTIIFCYILFLVWKQKTLNSKWSLGVFIASLIPFGAFVAESKLKRKL